MTDAASRRAKRWLYIGHRWIGIATCLLCAMWFVSGLVMMYVPYPRLTERERIALLADIDGAQIAVSPTEAMGAAGLTRFPAQLRLAMLLGEPVYRIVDGPTRVTVSARDGRLIGGMDAEGALRVVHMAQTPSPLRGGSVRRTGVGDTDPYERPPDLLPQPSPARGEGVRPSTLNHCLTSMVDTLVRDQWTVAQGFDPHRPLHKVSLGDAAGTESYVSSPTAEIVQATTRTQRFWNWLGSVPHWIYPTVLRQDGAAWRQVVLWTSGPATIGAIAGVWIGILRLRLRRRYRGERITPYRGWMKWHHVAGILAGVTLTTWLASGWLSVNPFRWFSRDAIEPAALRAYTGHAGPDFPSASTMLQHLSAPGAREARFVWLDGRTLIVATGISPAQRVFDDAGASFALTEAQIAAAATNLVPGAPLAGLARLDEEDAYWYSHHVERRLPVLRAVFEDDARTWIHIDPTTGEILGRTDASGRTYRWLFNALHDFDLRVLLRHRPAWDIVVWLLSFGGLIVSVSGAVVGWRRLGRKLA